MPDGIAMTKDYTSRSNSETLPGPNLKLESGKSNSTLTRKKIILIGATGAGKSTFINTAAGSNLAVSASLASCTTKVASVVLELEDGIVLELVDTPGFDDSLRSDIEILEEIVGVMEDWDNIHGIIYLHRISDVRISGSARRGFTTFYKMCGQDAMSHVSIVTNMWDRIPHEEGLSKERELLQDPMFFGQATCNGATSLRNDSSVESVHCIVRSSLRQSPVQLLIQKEYYEENKNLLRTSAGVFLDNEMAETRMQHIAELSKLDEEYEAAQKLKDIETKAELEQERELLAQKLRDMELLYGRYTRPKVDQPGCRKTASRGSRMASSSRYNSPYGKKEHHTIPVTAERSNMLWNLWRLIFGTTAAKSVVRSHARPSDSAEMEARLNEADEVLRRLKYNNEQWSRVASSTSTNAQN